MRPLADAVRAVDCTGGGSGITITRTKPAEALHHRPPGAPNNRRQVSSSEREMPYRRAVDETARGDCKLSTTILSFSHGRSTDDAGQSQQPRTVQPRNCTYCSPQGLLHSTPLNLTGRPSPEEDEECSTPLLHKPANERDSRRQQRSRSCDRTGRERRLRREPMDARSDSR